MGAGKGTPAPGYVGPGDVVPGATSWWGLRAYNGAYATGSNPAIDVVDTATGTTTTTINILNDGSLDVATIAGLGYGVSVTKVYDQVGTNDLVQTTLSQMPTILLNAVGIRPAMVFGTGANQGLDAAETHDFPQPITVSTFINPTDTTGSPQYLFTFNGTPGTNVILDNGQASGNPVNPSMNAGASISLGATPTGSWYAFQCVFNSATSDFNVDGTANTGDTGTNEFAAVNIQVSLPLINFNIYSYLTEVGYWLSAFDATADSAPMSANQHAWWS